MGAYRTNTCIAIDPDFGKRTISAGIIYRVNVTPANKKAKKWMFYLLMPRREEETDLELREESDEANILSHIIERFLEMGDYYQVIDVKDEDSQSFDNSIPVLSFNPLVEEDAETEWVWITPPLSDRH